jgi:DNA-directed RNA polymerase specialized sigma24 family protein
MRSRRDQRSLFAECLPVLSAFVRRIAGDAQAAKEILQEVSVRALAGEGPDEPERFLAWCCGVARHVLASEWRMRKRARAEIPIDDELAEAIGAPHFDLESYVDARAWVSRARRRVDTPALNLLVRRYVFEETGAELAGELEQSSAALRMRLMRLRSVLLGGADRDEASPLHSSGGASRTG